MAKKAPQPVEILRVTRTRSILEGAVQSRSDPERQYLPRIILSSNILDTCNGSQMRGVVCAHVRDLVQSLSKEELVAWILDSHTVPPPFNPDEER